VVLFGQDGGHQPDRGGAVGKDPHDVGAAADLAVEALLWVVGQIWRQQPRGNAV
jgi:hypothetical protein